MAFRNPCNFGIPRFFPKICLDVSVVEVSHGLHNTEVCVVQTDATLLQPLVYSPTQLQDDILCGAPLQPVRSDVLSSPSESVVNAFLDSVKSDEKQGVISDVKPDNVD